MATRFELVLDHDRLNFQLSNPTGQPLLIGLGGTSKIMLQNDILHLRQALRDPAHLVPHESSDGRHFLTVKDNDGAVLAKSPHVATRAALAELSASILALAGAAPIVDRTRHAPVH